MPDDAAAIPAGLKRILADSFVLRFLAQAASWRIEPDARDGVAAVLKRLIGFLDDIAMETAIRIRVLGDTPPNAMDELIQFSSCRPLLAGEAADGLSRLAHATLLVTRDFHTMGQIARESGDEATAHFLFARTGLLEETVWSIGQFVTGFESRGFDQG
ncbi:MAG TPA: ferritin-like domain-containing protein [Caulobacteraceae bacterium]|jgi:DNA-binding ferritin-like protein